MAHIVRRCTVGKAQALYNDLLENLVNHMDYKGNLTECKRDDELAVILCKWLSVENKREA